MKLRRLGFLGVLFAALCAIAAPAWSNGGIFFQLPDSSANPDYVIFGSVKNDAGKYIDGATVVVKVKQPALAYVATTNVMGRYRTVDVGRIIKDLGYDVEPSGISVDVEYPGYGVSRRDQRSKHDQKAGAVEVDFVIAPGAK